MSKSLAIQPFLQTTTQTISNIRLSVHELVLFQSVTIRVECFDANNNFIELKFVTINGDDYLNWMNNDEYIAEYVKTKLGFTSYVPPPFVPPPVIEIPVEIPPPNFDTPVEEPIVPPVEEPVVPPVEETVVPPVEETVVPPVEETVVPPVEETVVPPVEETVVPPVEEPVVPPTEEVEVPPPNFDPPVE